MEASGMAVMQKFISTKKQNPCIRKKSDEQRKQTLAVAVGLGKVPMLPEKLLEELLPGIRGALFKGR
jgi:phage terminase small subunit